MLQTLEQRNGSSSSSPVIASQIEALGLDSLAQALVPTPLEWAFAIVRSRCVKIVEDWFGVLPVLDMANHSLDPSADVKMIVPTGLQGEEGEMPTDTNISQLTLCLCATRDLSEGEEVTISYGEDYPNRRLFVQYGFVLDCNPHDMIQWKSLSPAAPPSSTEEAGAQGLSEEAAKVAQAAKEEVLASLKGAFQKLLEGRSSALVSAGVGDLKDRIVPVTRSLSSRVASAIRDYYTSSSSSSSSVAATLPPPPDTKTILQTLLFELDEAISSLPTSLIQDRQHIASIQDDKSAAEFVPLGQAKEAVDGNQAVGVAHRSQMLACLMQRVQRKTLLACARDVVRAALDLDVSGP